MIYWSSNVIQALKLIKTNWQFSGKFGNNIWKKKKQNHILQIFMEINSGGTNVCNGYNMSNVLNFLIYLMIYLFTCTSRMICDMCSCLQEYQMYKTAYWRSKALRYIWALEIVCLLTRVLFYLSVIFFISAVETIKLKVNTIIYQYLYSTNTFYNIIFICKFISHWYRIEI
jgi:hypothetical protein